MYTPKTEFSFDFLEQSISMNRLLMEKLFTEEELAEIQRESHEMGMKEIEIHQNDFFQSMKESKFRKPYHSLLYLKTVYICENHHYIRRMSMIEIREHSNLLRSLKNLP